MLADGPASLIPNNLNFFVTRLLQTRHFVHVVNTFSFSHPLLSSSRLTRKIYSAELQRESSRMAMSDGQEKALLFMGHRIRVVNQQVFIQKFLNLIKMNCVTYRTKE
jgi:hypothetical protein